MSLRQTISEAQKIALKGHDEDTLGILRVLWSAIKNMEIDKKHELSDEEIQTVVAIQVKQLNDALKDFVSAQRQDLINKTTKELAVLKKYLPIQISDQELEAVIKRVINESGSPGLSELGKVMSLVMKEVKGKADGNKVREWVSKLLSA